MTIDEAIIHAEEVAEENEKNAKNINNIYKKSCLECAAEHRQLAEWLRELKAWRDFGASVGQLLGKYLTEEQIKKLEEVTADGDNNQNS